MNARLIFGVIMVAVLASGFAAAHPPSRVDLEFDSTNRILTVTVKHPTRDAAEHYINKLVVALNDEEIIEQEISLQPNDESVRVSYILPDAGMGDTIVVTAHCNVFGKKKATYEIPEGE